MSNSTISNSEPSLNSLSTKSGEGRVTACMASLIFDSSSPRVACCYQDTNAFTSVAMFRIIGELGQKRARKIWAI